MSLVEQLLPDEQVTPTATSLHRQSRRAAIPLYLVTLAIAVALTPVMMYAEFRYGIGLVLGGVVGVVLLVLTLRAPIFGFYVLVFAAVVIEQDPLATPIGTDTLYVFSWPARMAGLPERPIGFYILFILLFLVAVRLATRKAVILQGGALLAPFLAFLACVALGVIYGLASGGVFRIIVLEVRPFWYLFSTYLVALNLVREKRHVLTFFWILVVGTFFKALQGCYIVITTLHGHISGANEIMAHEQSYFFIQVLLLILLCILMKRLRALMWVAVASLPFLIIALMANNRRADYLAFALGAVAVWFLAIKINTAYRKQLIVALIATSVVVGSYILVFSSINTPISQPANAIISVIEPSKADARDTASNLYRFFEDADLQYTEKLSPIIGYGFGKPFATPDPLPNIIGLDPYYLYIPHNNILWIWMRLGPIGYLAFWYLISAAIVRAGIIMKRLRDPDLQLVAMFVIGSIVMEVPLAYGDYQIYFYRNVFITGLLLGMLLRLPSIDAREQSNSDAERTRATTHTTRVASSPAARHQSAAGARWRAVNERKPADDVRSAPRHEPDDGEERDDRGGHDEDSERERVAAALRLRARYASLVWERHASD